MSSSLFRFSGWRSRSLSLGEGLTDLHGARDGTRADGVLDRGRRRLFSFWRSLPGGAVELPGRSRPAPGVVDIRRPGVSVDHTCCGHARARGARQFERALRQSDLLEPPGRRCGCWSTSPFLFSGIVVCIFLFGGDDGARRSMMICRAGLGRRPQRGTGPSTTDRKTCRRRAAAP